MSKAALDKLFDSCTLELFAADTSVTFPEQDTAADPWLAQLKQENAQRRQAFFDEHLQLFLTAKIPIACNPSPINPPDSLLEFLAYTQVSLEATYISPQSSRATQPSAVLAPPRSSSVPLPVAQARPRTSSLHPSIYPPATPNPVPSAAESDRKYAQAEGTLLLAHIWGQNSPADSPERFALLFSDTEKAWIAVYRLSVVISFLRLPMADPLLCLTVSATLRDMPVSLSQSNHPFVAYLSSTGLLESLKVTITAAEQSGEAADAEDRKYVDFEEINLLEGLASGPTFSSESDPLYLPSSRVTEGVRLKRHSQATVFTTPPADEPSSSSSRRTTRPIMRKSFRKVLPTVSGFRVRLRTVFVPYVLLPGHETSLDEREAGSNERTVVLCVEVENSGESGPNVGFSVEHVDISIGGEGATTRLIGWGEDGLKSNAEKRLFPLSVASMEQYNLLYAVSFLSSPQDNNVVRAAGSGFPGQSNQTHGAGMQRAVTINILGKPFEKRDQDTSTLPAPTQTFSSRWNCVLDLSANPLAKEDPIGFSDPFGATRNAHPEPASPFPTHSALGMSPLSTPQGRAGLEIKRHTLPGFAGALRAGAGNITANFRLSLPGQDRAASPNPPSKLSYTPPSVAMQAYSRSPRTSFSAPIANNAPSSDNASMSETLVAPLTPAYPAFSPRISAPPVPFSQPLGAHHSVSGPSVEIRRDRGLAYGGSVPQTPGPTVETHLFADSAQDAQASTGDPIVISVGLLPLAPNESGNSPVRMIYPSDTFTLDIFILNRSSWTRRFEISYPDNVRQKPSSDTGSKMEGRAAFEELKSAIVPPGILPLQNRIRVGPLRPSTSQSVRMDFTALRSGVHSIDILTLTDVESGYRRNLRSVLDVVVHER